MTKRKTKSRKTSISASALTAKARVIHAEKQAKAKIAAAKKKFVATEKKIHSFLKKHPEEAMAAAAALGAAVGVAATIAAEKKAKKKSRW